MIEPRVYEAAVKLQSPELKAFYDWLQSERSSVLEMLSTAKPELIGVLQGEAQRLKKILDLIETARAVIDKQQK